MKHLFTALTVGGALLAAGPAAADAGRYTEQSRAAVKEFFGTLKAELVGALKAGGPVNAIAVCNVEAPAIAASMSEKKGWDIGRTSLKLRNPNNAPDAWEKAVLESFEARKAKGESPKAMEHAEIVTQEGGKVFRYMKAIPTAAEPCLVCHGEKLDPAVAAALDDKYPQDQARGYSEGDIRGAFTISFPVE